MNQDDGRWQKLFEGEKNKTNPNFSSFVSPEGLTYEPLYSEKKLKNKKYKESFPGVFPYTRGPYASMYSLKPWTIRQYGGFSSAKETNLYFKRCLEGGQKGLSVAFDLPTHRGYDSDHERVSGDVGKAGVAIDSVEDMKELFEGISLKEISVSMTMNGAVLPILASYIVAAEEQGVQTKDLQGTIQNDILKEYMVRNTYIYPPEPSMRIVGDIIAYTSAQMPKFNSVSISGYHLQEAGANAALELAYTIADGLEYVKAACARGMDVDTFAPRLSFFFAIGMNFFTEIAKLRAARKLWATLMKEEFNPRDEKSLILRTHCQTSGYSLSEQKPFNNIVRTTVEALAAVLGGTQSLHTNALDEAIALPSDFSSTIARDTQLILNLETDITKTIDPFGGSYFMESLTLDLESKARELIDEIKKTGGMTKAILKGIPQNRIAQSATLKQARLDNKEDLVVGVNCYQEKQIVSETDADDSKATNPIRTIDSKEVLGIQIKKLTHLKNTRNQKLVDKTLSDLEIAAKGNSTNLLEKTIDAIRARATLGEVSECLAKAFGRYAPAMESINYLYGKQMSSNEEFQKTFQMVKDFEKKFGRRPRILVAKLGQDGHDRGAKVIASGFSDLGFDVDLGALFQTPEEVAKLAIESDVHLIGISTLTAAHNTLVPKLMEVLKERGSENIKVVLGGVIPKMDHPFLITLGVSLIFSPGTPIYSCAQEILKEFLGE